MVLLKTLQLWICYSFNAVLLPWPLKWDFGGNGRTAWERIAIYVGFNGIVELMFPKLKYTSHSFLLPKLFVRCVWSGLPNRRTIIAPSGQHSFWLGYNHSRHDNIQLTYLVIPPLVTWFHVWEDTLLTINECPCCSVCNMVPECRLLHEERNASSKIGVIEMCEIIVAKVIPFGQSVVTQFAIFPRVNTH